MTVISLSSSLSPRSQGLFRRTAEISIRLGWRGWGWTNRLGPPRRPDCRADRRRSGWRSAWERFEDFAAAWPQVVRALEQAKGQSWSGFANRQGDWGRDAALWLGRRVARLRLLELGKLAGGLDYGVVTKAITRFSRRLAADADLRERLAVLQEQLSQ